MQSDRRKSQGEPQKCPYWDFRHLLTFEKERSERHNHFFSVFGLSMTGLYSEEMMEGLRDQLRASDYVFAVPAPDRTIAASTTRIGVLLPETDLQGAELVRKRLVYLCGMQGAQVRIGLAVYPDHATVPEQLLALAFNVEWPVGGAQIAGCRLAPT